MEKVKDIKTKNYLLLILCLICLSGCDSFRFAPSETQKQNAWLHNRTIAIASQKAAAEGSSEQLQALTKLAEIQGSAIAAYFGAPKELPEVSSEQEILAEANYELAQTARQEAMLRPDVWEVTGSVMDLGIGIAAILGGVYGSSAVRFLKTAREKSKALQEVVKGNELFKKQNADSASAFKAAHSEQSSATRQIVAQIKTQA